MADAKTKEKDGGDDGATSGDGTSGDGSGAAASSSDDLEARVESVLRTALPKVLDELYPAGGDGDGDGSGDDDGAGDGAHVGPRATAANVERDVERRVREELARVTSEKERDEAMKVLGEKVAAIEKPPMALRKLTRAIWGSGDE